MVLPPVARDPFTYETHWYMGSLTPTAPPWSPQQHGINIKSATDIPSKKDPLVCIASKTSLSFATSLNMDALIASFQQPMVKAQPYGSHPAAHLLVSYTSDGFPASAGLHWPLSSIRSAISKGPHTSTLKPEATTFVCTELQEQVQWGFSIIISVDDALAYFGTRLCISRLASMDQSNRKPRLICNSFAAPDSNTPSVDASTESSTNPHAIQFEACLPCLLQKNLGSRPDRWSRLYV